MNEKQLLNELKESILNDTFYDFISNNYYLLSKEQLANLLKNYDYTRYQLEKGNFDLWKFMNKFIDNLNDYDFFEKEE